MQQASPALLLRSVHFGYGTNTVLDIEELSLTRGEPTFLYGPSGSGKTTLLGLITGILEYQKGSVQVFGQELASLSRRQRDEFRGAQIGYIFQMFNLIPYLTVRQNIELPCEINPERRARVRGGSLDVAVRELATHLEIDDVLNQSVLQLSVGQQQRVAAARALLGAPPLIVADEPTSALDWDRREAFLRLLFREAEAYGATILFVSHDQSLKSLFSRAISLDDVNQAAQKKGSKL